MWSVQRPEHDAGETFAICIGRVGDAELRQNLTNVRGNVEEAAEEYAIRAANGELYVIPPTPNVGAVPGDEMVKVYTSRMARKGSPGRQIYDQIKILPEGDRCPFCDHRNVSTLDHILPKQHHSIFAVTPINLVAACADCNKARLDVLPTGAADTVLHPYFDEIDNQHWLTAEVIERSPAAVTFAVATIDEWGADLRARLRYQFELLGLAELYSSQAARETTNIRENLRRHYDYGGADAVQGELTHQWQSRRANRMNSWQTACYEALANSDWYCNTGFAQV